MAQPTFTEVRQALAAALANISGLNATAERVGQVNPPVAIVLPVTGSFARYQTTFEGSCDITLRAVLLVAEGDSSLGQDLMDAYLAPTGAGSVNAAIQADPTLGGVVQSAALTEATGYGPNTWNDMPYLGCQLIVEVEI